MIEQALCDVVQGLQDSVSVPFAATSLSIDDQLAQLKFWEQAAQQASGPASELSELEDKSLRRGLAARVDRAVHALADTHGVNARALETMPDHRGRHKAAVLSRCSPP